MYCHNCGNKYLDDGDYCAKCGAKRLISNQSSNNAAKKETKNTAPVQTKKSDPSKIILILGVFLVVFASFIFGVVSWENTSDIFKIGFFGFECALFFGLSFVLKLIKSKISRVFFVIGLVLIPYTLTLIPYYNLLSSYYTSGAGLYIYLAICYALSGFIYILANINFKSKILSFLIIVCFLIVFIFVPLAFEDKELYAVGGMICYSLILSIIYAKNNSKLIKGFNCILFVINSILLILMYRDVEFTYNFYDNFYSLLYCSLFLVQAIITFIFVCKESDVSISYLLCTILSLLTVFASPAFINFDSNYFFLAPFLFMILFSSISLVLRKNNLTNFFVIGSLLILLISFVRSFLDNYYLELTIISSISFVYNLILVLFNKNKWLSYVIPFTLVFIVVGVYGLVFDTYSIYILSICSLFYTIMYIILSFMKNTRNRIYLFGAIALLLIGIFSYMLFNFSFMDLFKSELPFELITIITSGILFVFTSFFNENALIKIISYFLFIVFTMFMSETYALGFSIITITTCLLAITTKNSSKFDMKPFLVIAHVLVFFTFLSMNNLNLITYILIIISYLSAYLTLKTVFNTNSLYRVIFSILGLFIMYRIVHNYLIPIPIYFIVAESISFVILTILFLSDIETKKGTAFISLAMLVPYFSYVNYTFGDIDEFKLIPVIIYTVVLIEISKFNEEKDRKVLISIMLSIYAVFLIYMNTSDISFIIDIIIALCYIVYGIFRKINYVIYLGVGLILLTVYLKLYSIFNNLALVALLIVIGFILIGIALYFELKKKKE